MASAISRDEEEAVAIRSKTHTAHPDTALTTVAILQHVSGLRNERSGFRDELCNHFLLVDVNAHDDTRVVEQVAMSAECSVDD